MTCLALRIVVRGLGRSLPDADCGKPGNLCVRRPGHSICCRSGDRAGSECSRYWDFLASQFPPRFGGTGHRSWTSAPRTAPAAWTTLPVLRARRYRQHRCKVCFSRFMAVSALHSRSHLLQRELRSVSCIRRVASEATQLVIAAHQSSRRFAARRQDRVPATQRRSQDHSVPETNSCGSRITRHLFPICMSDP